MRQEEDEGQKEDNELMAGGVNVNYKDGQQAAQEMKQQKEREEIKKELEDLKDSSDGEEIYTGVNR